MNKLITTILIVVSGLAYGQQIDEAKMQRDIEVAENILGTLAEGSRFGRSPFEGTYVEGFGVIFNATSSLKLLYLNDDDKVNVVTGRASGYAISGSSFTNKNGVIFINNGVGKTSADSLKNDVIDKWVEDAKTFLTDYAQLIGQLKPDEKILITNAPSGLGSNRMHVRWVKVARASVEGLKKDIDAYHAGKITKEKLLEKIKVTKQDSESIPKDVELLANIMETVYKRDLSQTYYISGHVYAEKINDLGVILQMKVYSSTSDRDGLHRIVTQNTNGLSQDERNEKVKALYPEFLEDLKKNLVQYGRTITSLNSEERILLNVELTQCLDCGIPEKIEVAVKQEDLMRYNSGKLSESQAIQLVSVKEIGKQ